MGTVNQIKVRPQFFTPTAAAHAAFIPTGIVTVLLGPILPSLAARWSLNDTQSGELFFTQFAASTGGVALSGVLTPRFGYRTVLVLGLLFMAAGVGVLPLGSWWLGMGAVAIFGFGLGLTIPTSNLLVAEVNPTRRAAALNLLNFSWSAGAVACPFLLAPFQKTQQASLFLFLLAGFILLVAATLAGVSLPRLNTTTEATSSVAAQSLARLMGTPAAIALAILFFTYVGTENAVGGWLATYAKRIASGAGTLWVTTPSFFYGGLLAGRIVAPFALKRTAETNVARVGVAISLLGVLELMLTNSMAGVMAGGAVIGIGLSAIYPITIALLSQNFGAAAARLGSVMFALAGFGAGCFPWMVGFTSTRLSSLRLGLMVPLAGCVVMLALYFRKWGERRNATP
jgi:fucose permease